MLRHEQLQLRAQTPCPRITFATSTLHPLEPIEYEIGPRSDKRTGGKSMEDPVLGDGRRQDGSGRRIRQGGCLCGRVRFELRGEPLVTGLCHCLECRKSTGGFAMAYAKWAPSEFTCTGETSVIVGRSYCAGCGSQVFHLNPSAVSVLLGALDEAPSDLVPTAEGWTVRREPWMQPVSGAKQFDYDVE